MYPEEILGARPSPDGIGLVLSGGGAKGAYQVGVVQCLADRGIRLTGISGASVGALNGALVACAPNLTDAAARLNAIWRELADAPPAELRLGDVLPPLVLGHYLGLLLAAGEPSILVALHQITSRFSAALANAAQARALDSLSDAPVPQRLGDLLDRHLSVDALDSGLPFYVSVFQSGGGWWDLIRAVAGISGLADTPLSEFLHVQALSPMDRRRAILASAALPLLFEVQRIGDRTYADGGLGGLRNLQGNTPIAPLLDETGAGVVIVSHLVDGSSFDRHRFPLATIVEIRPSTPIRRRGGLRDTLGFTRGQIEGWIEQGYVDTERVLDQVTNALGILAEARLARQRRDRALRSLLDSRES